MSKYKVQDHQTTDMNYGKKSKDKELLAHQKFLETPVGIRMRNKQ